VVIVNRTCYETFSLYAISHASSAAGTNILGVLCGIGVVRRYGLSTAARNFKVNLMLNVA